MEVTFREALAHCRWKSVLRQVIRDHIRVDEHAGRTFEQVFEAVHAVCSRHKGLGLLTAYDLAAGICEHHGVAVRRVYLVGNGPRRAHELLGMRGDVRVQRVGTARLPYVEVEDVERAWVRNGLPIDPMLRMAIDARDGDLVESCMCNWQKTVPKPPV